jgi:hypothetical protein
VGGGGGGVARGGAGEPRLGERGVQTNQGHAGALHDTFRTRSSPAHQRPETITAVLWHLGRGIWWVGVGVVWGPRGPPPRLVATSLYLNLPPLHLVADATTRHSTWSPTSLPGPTATR